MVGEPDPPDGDEARRIREVGGPLVDDAPPEVVERRLGDVDFEDQERDRDREDAVTERLRPARAPSSSPSRNPVRPLTVGSCASDDSLPATTELPLPALRAEHARRGRRTATGTASQEGSAEALSPAPPDTLRSADLADAQARCRSSRRARERGEQLRRGVGPKRAGASSAGLRANDRRNPRVERCGRGRRRGLPRARRVRAIRRRVVRPRPRLAQRHLRERRKDHRRARPALGRRDRPRATPPAVPRPGPGERRRPRSRSRRHSRRASATCSSPCAARC